MTNPEQVAARFKQCRVLDGGLATELERHGLSLGGQLWSGQAILDQPASVLAVHRSYLHTGADILLTASYQVSAMGFAAQGISHADADVAASGALRQSVALARQAAEQAGRPETLIASSLGPYGAALANGSEFHGCYGFANPQEEHHALVRFHAQRIAALAGTNADLLAFETVPSLAEAHAIVEALSSFPGLAAWLSFTCSDAVHTAHGERLRNCAHALDAADQVIAIGINCTPPALIEPLLRELRLGTAKPLLAYPNSGEGWDAERRCWLNAPASADAAGFGDLAARWFRAGASIVGGCCRTTPEHVRAIRVAASGL
jgi:homocysteine S-methyltransferase